MSRKCAICQQLGDTTCYILCDAFGEHFCLECCGLHELPVGLWYCTKCLVSIAAGSLWDVTADLPLMRYLFQGKLPADDEEAHWVIAASRFLCVAGRDLIINGRDGDRVVPAITKRYELLDSCHCLNHCHGE